MANRFPPHPGTITFADLSRGTEERTPVDEVPERQRFVHLRDGVETDDPLEATERVPIVLVEMAALDARGRLVAPEEAATIHITEFGEDRRWLRSTEMVRG